MQELAIKVTLVTNARTVRLELPVLRDDAEALRLVLEIGDPDHVLGPVPSDSALEAQYWKTVHTLWDQGLDAALDTPYVTEHFADIPAVEERMLGNAASGLEELGLV